MTYRFNASASSSLETSPSLVDRVRAQEAQAWQRLVDLYGPLVFGWSCRAGLSHEDAADVMQEVFLSVSKAILRFDPRARGRFRGWLWTITRNKLRDHYRNAAPFDARGGDTANRLLGQFPEADFPEQWEDNSSDATRHEVQALYHRAMTLIQSDFEPQTWRAFWLSVVEEKSTEEIAGLLGLSANGVRQAKSRVLLGRWLVVGWAWFTEPVMYDSIGKSRSKFYLVDGVDGATLVQGCGPLPVADASEIIRQAAVGMAYVHENGIVYRAETYLDVSRRIITAVSVKDAAIHAIVEIGDQSTLPFLTDLWIARTTPKENITMNVAKAAGSFKPSPNVNAAYVAVAIERLTGMEPVWDSEAEKLVWKMDSLFLPKAYKLAFEGPNLSSRDLIEIADRLLPYSSDVERKQAIESINVFKMFRWTCASSSFRCCDGSSRLEPHPNPKLHNHFSIFGGRRRGE